jgi:adenosylcobyric acid synthase
MSGLMIQGTTSDAGKSLLVAGLCRVLTRKGFSVAPFKPQNMALNSAVTADGGEIGRAQALQAFACGLELRTDFNPVLLKPTSDKGSQVIIQGKVVSHLEAQTFGNIKELAFERVLESYHRLIEEFDFVIVEGAGSPAEINLRTNDIANMGFAEEVDCPVVLISDIDRGGVFAHIVGTLQLLSQSERERVKGVIINKFRGDIGLLQGGVDWLTSEIRKPVMGVLPFLRNLKLDAEDAISTEQEFSADGLDDKINVKVIVLPRISNHTDFEPLLAHPNVHLQYIDSIDDLAGADLVIIPGSKNVRDDLSFLKQGDWESAIKRHLRYGGKLIGICGGYQMLGESIDDPLAVEGTSGMTEGFSLFSFTTQLEEAKKLRQVRGTIKSPILTQSAESCTVEGYEIHCGETEGENELLAFAKLADQFGESYFDGQVSKDGQIIGTYIHGLFESAKTTQLLLKWVSGKQLDTIDWNTTRKNELDRLADMLESEIDIESIVHILQK